MHFLRVNVTFYDAVNMIRDVIRTVHPFPYAAKFMFIGVKKMKLDKLDVEIEFAHSVVVYQKYLTRLGD